MEIKGADPEIHRPVPVSYTHLDVYKRQAYTDPGWGTVCPDPCRIGHRTQSVTKDRLLYPDAGTIHNIDDIYFRVGE